jgi:hypothetical protein
VQWECVSRIYVCSTECKTNRRTESVDGSPTVTLKAAIVSLGHCALVDEGNIRPTLLWHMQRWAYLFQV